MPDVDPTVTNELFRTVVGWLVCIHGKERGRDYRLHPERNFIGRNPSMDVVIQGDNEISRDRHAEIVYDPRSKRFFLNRGADTRKNTYWNNEIVLKPVELNSGDLIELGNTKLLFIPFCGIHHDWFDKSRRLKTKEKKPIQTEPKPTASESNEDPPTENGPTDLPDDEQRTWVRSRPGGAWRIDDEDGRDDEQPQTDDRGGDAQDAEEKKTLGSERDRYTDLAIYRGWRDGQAVEPPQLLAATEPLEPQREYTLEVAIREELRGIESPESEKPLRNLREGEEDVTVMAVVSCRQPNSPIFRDHLLLFTWPFDSDSTSAFFHFETGGVLPPEPLRIEVRLYERAGLYLLDLLELTYQRGRWTKIRPDTGLVAVAKPPNSAVDSAVSFHIVGEPQGYGIEAVFLRDGEVRLVAPLGRAVLDGDLEDLLLRVRNYWTRLVIGKMSSRRGLSRSSYDDELAGLAALGGEAWRTLFGDRCGALQGTPEAMGALMRDAPLPPASPMRVTFASNAETFVFPWAILCPPHGRKGNPEPEAIWGLRYMIELTRKYEPDYIHQPGERVRIATTIDPGFAGTVDHRATLARVAAVGPGAELLDGNSENDVLDRLEAEPPADVYYYFCQGLTPGRSSSLKIDVVAEIEKTLAELPESDRKPWTMLLSRIKADPGVATMFTGAAALTEHELRRASFFKGRCPIVFLNMCQSADLLPSMQSGLTRVFLERGAGAVLGTECPVTSVFADMFAGEVLTDLMTGKTIGEAVLATRRRFHVERNPLGLLYTLYGHADARLVDATHTQLAKDGAIDEPQ